MDLPLSAGRIVMSVSALSSRRALNSPLLMLLAGLLAFLNAFSQLIPETLSLGADDRCLHASNLYQACWNCHCSAVASCFWPAIVITQNCSGHIYGNLNVNKNLNIKIGSISVGSSNVNYTMTKISIIAPT